MDAQGEGGRADGRPACKRCWRLEKWDFHVPDEVWAAVVPEHLRNRVVCLDCFDELARQADVNYAQALEGLWFAGDRAAFEFRAVAAVDVKH